jgi:anti-sigma factor RsiW
VTAAPCVEFAEELVAYLDGEQPPAEHARIETHVGTCLSCRRELERLRRVRTLLGALPVIEPSAVFQDALWQRLDVTPPTRGRRRTLVWGAPALAAAAALALVWYSLLTGVTTTEHRAPGAPVAVAHREAPHGGAGETRVAAQPKEAPDKDEKQPDVAVAGSDLDQYPPELVEHPELFLRYPVVKRLQRLQHFEEVRQHGDGEPLGTTRPNGTRGSSDTIG